MKQTKTKWTKNEKALGTYSSDNVDNTSNLRVYTRTQTHTFRSYEWISNNFQKCGTHFKCSIFRHCALSLFLTLSLFVFSCSFCFFFSGLIFLFSFPLVKNDRNITLRFLNIRICYLRWDVRGTNFRFVLSIWNGAFSYYIKWFCARYRFKCTKASNSNSSSIRAAHIECHIVAKMRNKRKNRTEKSINSHIGCARMRNVVIRVSLLDIRITARLSAHDENSFQ